MMENDRKTSLRITLTAGRLRVAPWTERTRTSHGSSAQRFVLPSFCAIGVRWPLPCASHHDTIRMQGRRVRVHAARCGALPTSW